MKLFLDVSNYILSVLLGAKKTQLKKGYIRFGNQ